MSGPRNPLPTSDVLDAVFARLRRSASGSDTPAPGSLLKDRTAPSSADDTIVEPVAKSPAEEEWLREERNSLQEFTRQQFALLRQQQQLLNQQRDELIGRQNALNETCLLRQQELNRQIKLLAAQTVQIENREKDLVEQEATLAVEAQKLLRVRDDLNAYRRQIAEEDDNLHQMRTETEEMIQTEKQLRQERLAEEATWKMKWETLEHERTQLQGRLDALNRRSDELDRAELAVNRRMAEVTALEQHVLSADFRAELDRLRAEIDQEKTTLAQIQVATQQARAESVQAEAVRAAIKQEQAEWEKRRTTLEQRMANLEKGEAQLQLRTSELEELESQLCNELHESERAIQRQRQELEEAERFLRLQRLELEQLQAGLEAAVAEQN